MCGGSGNGGCYRWHIRQFTIVVECFGRTEPRVCAFAWWWTGLILRLISMRWWIYFDISSAMLWRNELSAMCIGFLRHRNRCCDSHWIWHFFQHSFTSVCIPTTMDINITFFVLFCIYTFCFSSAHLNQFFCCRWQLLLARMHWPLLIYRFIPQHKSFTWALTLTSSIVSVHSIGRVTWRKKISKMNKNHSTHIW